MNKKSGDAALAERVLAHVRRVNYRPVKPRVIAEQLDLTEEESDRLRVVVKKLVKKGELRFGPRHTVHVVASKAPAASAAAEIETHSDVAEVESAEPINRPKSKPHGNMMEGVFKRAAAGFGFVRPKGTPPGAGRTLDVYVPKQSTADASSGDTVLVRLKRSSRPGFRDGRQEGEVVEIVSRDTHRFVGTYVEREGLGLVNVDGTVFAQPIVIGDTGAKGALPNDKVVVELVKFPTHFEPGEGVLIEVLGKRGAPGVDTLSILREYDLPDDFPTAVLDDARAQAERWNESIPADRTDLTGSVVITIDPVDARDFDDAISLERLDNGHWRLGVHIADVTHFVPAGSALDREARDRATSVYLPDRVIPMLPETISNNLASLQPNKVRFAKTAFLEFTAEGVRCHVECCSSAIRSQRRFAYEEVDDYLAAPEKWREKLAPPVHDLLGRMQALAAMLRRRRLERGAIELTLPEVKIDLNPEGEVAGAHLVANTESHQIIEEFMLAANEAVAEMFRDRGVHFLRRIHESPDLRKLTALNEFMRELGIEVDSMESRHEIKRVIALVKGRPEQHAVNYAVLRSMQKAVYSPNDEGHYALASDCYCHFTSPIRRYPDLTVHRTLDGLLRGKKAGLDFGQLVVLGQHCSDREQRAAAAERDLVKLKMLYYLSQHLGLEMDAVITGVEDFGLFTQGVGLPAEGLVHVDTLDDDNYYYDGGTHTLTGRRSGRRYRLGDVVRVRIQHVDLDRRELDFRLVEHIEGRGEHAQPKKWPGRSHGDTKSPSGPRVPRGAAPRKGAPKFKPPKGKRRRR